MPDRITELLEAYQGNAYPAMVADLAGHLGLPPEVLARLGLGWAPVVQFRKGPNYQGWWVIPERDAHGVVVGLSLRNQSDMKVMYPGTKHGLVYEVNPQHKQGAEGYLHGAHNWMRTMDAGVDCPVCHKPDGCLVSAEDPSDPRAAVCIREKVGATRPMRFGYLHILKDTGRINAQASALPESEHPVIVVEGMTDTATALSLGFVAVGRPSNLACMDLLRDLIRGRKVIIIGENDRKADGKFPGLEGAVATFQAVKQVCSDVIRVQPPEHIKDLRQWVTKFGLTQRELLTFAADHGQRESDVTVFPDQKPRTLAKLFLDTRYRLAGRYTLRNMRGEWYEYAGTKYRKVDDDTVIRGQMHEWLDDKAVEVVTAKNGATLQPVTPSITYINNIFDGMNAFCPIAEQPPCWVNGATGADPKDLIAFANGLLHVPSYLSGADESEYLLDPTPDYFTLAALPFPFDPLANCPSWKSYLRTTLGDDPKKIMLLQEWFGYCMTADTSQQKMMLMQGPRRAGKGVAANVLGALVGAEQTAAPSFQDLVGPFGLEGLVGKLLVVMDEADLARPSDKIQGLQIFLSVVGESPRSVARKNLTALGNHKLMCRFTLMANELPQLPDHAGALMSRLLVLQFSQSFVGREDRSLTHRLMQEVPGIAVWAMEGLRRLAKNGTFTHPESSATTLDEWRSSTSPVATFLEECCDIVAGVETSKEDLYSAWAQWAEERRLGLCTSSQFKQRVHHNCPVAISDCVMKDGHKYHLWRGLRLRPWALRQYLGKVQPR